MSKKIDIVVQGGIWPITNEVLTYYTQLPFVNNVILSTWVNEKYDSLINWPNVVRTDKPENGGQCNINLQLISSLKGVEVCEADVIVKCRSDQKIYDHCFTDLYEFFVSQFDTCSKLQYIDSSDTGDPIFVWGNNRTYPYCPQDHFFMGSKKSLVELFNCPLSENPVRGTHSTYGDHHAQADGNLQWETEDLRPNIHIGAHYCGKFSKTAKHHIDNYRQYLVDKAPQRLAAETESARIRDIVFKVMPRVDIFWEKTPDNKYPFAQWEPQGEYYYD
jgi:hypothetical protein